MTEVIERAPVGVLVLVDARIAYANRRAVEMTGYQRDELIGTEVRRIIHPEDVQESLARYGERVQGQHDEAGAGTGLGLSIVYAIVKQHQGRIFAESMPQKGTRFAIRFPAAERPVEEAAAPL